MSDDQERDTAPKLDRESGDDDLETEGHVKPNMDPTGEIDESDVPPQERDS